MGISKKFFVKILIFTLLFIGVLLVLSPILSLQPQQNVLTPKNPQAKIFQNKWNIDLDKMQSNGLLPKEWTDIKSIKAVIKSDLIKNWKNELTTPIDTHDDGHHHLEILFYSYEDPEQNEKVIMTQYSLYEIESTRLLWEMARNIKLPPTNNIDK